MRRRIWSITIACIAAATGCSDKTEPATVSETVEVAEVAEVAVEEVAADEPTAADRAAGAAALRGAMRDRAGQVFGLLPDEAASDANPLTDEKIELGRFLYFDPRLSRNQDISCNSCHGLVTFGVDSQPTSPGHKGQLGERNSPTVYNAALHVAQFWDGRSPDVEDQAKGPVLNPVEMAMPDEASVVAVLKSIPGYAPLFAAAFPGEEEPITYDNMARAIGAFERRLITSDRFAAFLSGEDDAISDDELAGLAVFMDVGCITCHMGPTLGGGLYRKLGLVEPYETSDPGRFSVTNDDLDRGVFKVPSLRNVEKTGPYFHDGAVAELAQAIRLMGKHQLGVELTDNQVASIEKFLGTLTGTVSQDYIAEPELPESGPDTPGPDPS